MVVALAATLALAVLAAHPKVRAWEERFGLSFVSTSGVPFLLLGVLYAAPGVGVLHDRLLADLRPAFDFALGWIGFSVGSRLDVRRLESLPSSFPTVVALTALIPMALTVAFAAPLLVYFGLTSGSGLVRDLIVLAACAAASGSARLRGVSASLRAVTDVDELASLGLLALVTIWFRPDAAGTMWVLPPSGWLLALLGVGTLLGVLTHLLLRGGHDDAERVALLVGAVALSAGIAGYLALSVPVVCALAGATLVNLPLSESDRLSSALVWVERPLYFMLLMVVGAAWKPWGWEGFALAFAFAAGRIVGKIAGASFATRAGALPDNLRLAVGTLLPQSPIAVVVIVAAAATWFGELPDAAHWAITAVIVGSLLAEVAARVAFREAAR